MATMFYEGFGCDVVLDTDAGTVTLNHNGKLTQKHKKESSPWVIPLGAITEVQFKEKSALSRGWVRFILTDRVGWARDEIEDVNAFLAGKQKVGEFVAAVEAARAGVPPVAMMATPARSTLGRMQDKTAELQAKAAEAEQLMRDNASFQGVAIRDGARIEFHGQTFPIAGARAIVEVGGTQRRTTATRVVVGSVVTLGVGTVIGAMAKKKTSNVYVTVELADGQVIVVDADSKYESKAREFAANLTSAGARAVTSASTVQVIEAEVVEDLPAAPAPPPIAPPPPPPPSVPADWYPDPDNTTLLRYWDGGRWTEHTAPRVSQ